MAKLEKQVSTPAKQNAHHTQVKAAPHKAPAMKSISGLNNIQKWGNRIVPPLLLVLLLYFMQNALIYHEKEVLYKSQELSLWFDDKTFYDMFSIYPGGWLSWAGSYMTQFFYHPSTGVWMLMGAWALIMAMLSWLYNLKGWRMLITALVPMMLLAALTQTGYWIYYQKLHGHMWVPTLGVGISILAALIYHKLLPSTSFRKDKSTSAAETDTPPSNKTEVQHITWKKDFKNIFSTIKIPFQILSVHIRKPFKSLSAKLPKPLKSPIVSAALCTLLRLLFMALFAWYGYKYMGAWAAIGVVLMAVPTKPRHVVEMVIPVLAAAALIYFVPRWAYGTVFEQTKWDEIYTAGLPCFRHGQTDVAIYREVYRYLAVAFIPAMLFCWTPRFTNWMARGFRTDSSIPASKAMSYFMLAIEVIILIVCVVKYDNKLSERWNHDKNFHTEIAMSNAIDRKDWEGVLEAMMEREEMREPGDTLKPTRAMVMMKNLALFRLGRTGNEMFFYPEGAESQNQEEVNKYKDMYGDADYIYTFPKDISEEEKQNYRWQIRLTQVAGKTLYYNYGKLNFCYRWCMEDAVEFGWNVEQLKLMACCSMLKGEDRVAHKFFNILKRTRYHREWAEHYEQYIGHPEKMKADPAFEQICYLMNVGDRLDGDNSLIELYLLQTFANGNGADPVYQEMTLISALLMKDIQLFWPRFARYAEMHNKPDFKMPRHYQEAAYLYGQLEPQSRPVQFERWPFDKEVVDTYKRFMNFNNRRDIAPLSEKDKAERFKPQFGHTFYYFYFLVRGQKTN